MLDSKKIEVLPGEGSSLRLEGVGNTESPKQRLNVLLHPIMRLVVVFLLAPGMASGQQPATSTSSTQQTLLKTSIVPDYYPYSFVKKPVQLRTPLKR